MEMWIIGYGIMDNSIFLCGGDHTLTAFCPLAGQPQTRQKGYIHGMWKLVPTDKTPAGKRDDISLREKEKEIQKDLEDGIDTIGKKMTVCELYA